MKILHIGGAHQVTAPLAQAQVDQGHDVTALGVGAGSTPFMAPRGDCELTQRLQDILAGRFDVVHLHGLQTISEGPTLPEAVEQSLRALRESGARIVLSITDDHPLLHLSDAAGKNAVRELLSTYTAFVLIGVGSAEPLVPDHVPAAWCPVPYLGFEDRAMPAGAQHGQLRVLLLDPDDSLRSTTQTLSTSPMLRERISFESVVTSQISSTANFSATLQRVDVMISSLQTARLDLPVLQALVHGRAVLSHNPTAAMKYQPTLPLVDAAPRSIAKKLENILREPRCLQDYAKRSREYVLRYHAPQMTYVKILQAYQN